MSPSSREPPRGPDERDWEWRRQRRAIARRRRRARRLGTLGAVVGAAVIVGVVLLSGGSSGGRSAPRRTAAEAPRETSLPRGGRTILPGHLVVADYGIVGTSNILGHGGSADRDAADVERRAAAYARFGVPVVPAFELVVTEAVPEAGPHDTYSAPVADAIVRRYLAAAHRHRLLLILDFQPGRSEFLPQVRRYARYLSDPSVGVALDPEWKLTADEVPDQVIGSASAASINAVSAYLSQLVAARRLPQKLFVIHEFRTAELPDRSAIAFRPGLATVLQMDGEGTVATKLAAYHQVQRAARGFYPGFKVFLQRTDDPTRLSPAQIMGLRPRPRYISYQ